MGDVISIELLLDADSERSVRDDWDRLSDAGMSSAGAHRSADNRPHVTLMVRTQLPHLAFDEALPMLPVELTIGDPIVFDHGDRGVLARPIAQTDDLLRFHRCVHAAAPPGVDAPHTSPGHWTPHITLARRLRLDALDDALALVGSARRGFGVSLRRWDSRTRTVTALDADTPGSEDRP